MNSHILLLISLLVKITFSTGPLKSKNANLGVPMMLNFAILSVGFTPKDRVTAGSSSKKIINKKILIETGSGTKSRYAAKLSPTPLRKCSAI